jgi:tetratricopeptide (TPR) repeat protein
MRTTGSLPVALFLTAATLAPRSASAQEQELQRIADALNAIGVELESLTAQYAKPDVSGPTRRFSDRLTDGEILFLLGDYQRASLVLYDLVANRRASSDPQFAKALYYLAESLFQIGHDLSAREYFQELVRRRDQKHLVHSIKRLIEIADRTQRWQGLEEHVAVLEARGTLPAGIAYINAKSLLRQRRPAEALEVARKVPNQHKLGAKAAYLAGVAQLMLGRLDEAQETFEALTRVDDSYEDAGRLRELAAMNRGRILLEQGDFSRSVDAYQFVNRSSPLFEEALYEVTWTYVSAAAAAADEDERRREFEKARKALEILLLSEAETPLAPEARLLLGNIQIRLSQYETATETFDQVVERYGPVRDVLRETEEESIDPERYFQEISSGNGGGGTLPPLAVRWAVGQGRLKKAMGVVEDLDRSEASLTEADEVVDKLLGVLDSERRASFFPALQDAEATAMQHGNSLVALTRRLLAVEREVVAEGLDDAQATELDRLLEERRQIEPQYMELPKKKEDYEGQLAAMRRRMQEAQQQAFRLKYTINSIRAQLSALRIWIQQNRDFIDAKARHEYAARLQQEELVVADLEAAQATLEAEVSREKSLISITSEAEERDLEIRTRYEASLEREREILGTVENLSPQSAGLLHQVVRLRKKVAGYRAELEKFNKHLNDAVLAKAGDLKAEVLKERAVLERYRRTIVDTRGDAKRVIGEIARGSFNDVKQRFQDIVLRADVGIVDVAWALKEEQTHAISRRVNEQRRELRVLDEEFADVLEGTGGGR